MSDGKHNRPKDEAVGQQESGIESAPATDSRAGEISEGRRRFTKAGLLAPPVLMSVASRPVFGVNCLSNALSGNLSHPKRGLCGEGLAPHGIYTSVPNEQFKDIFNSIDSTYDPENSPYISDPTSFNSNKKQDWIVGVLTGNKEDEVTPIWNPDYRNAAFIIVAWVNAKINGNPNGPYPLTPMQVLGVWKGDYVNFISHSGGLEAYLWTTLQTPMNNV